MKRIHIVWRLVAFALLSTLPAALLAAHGAEDECPGCLDACPDPHSIAGAATGRGGPNPHLDDWGEISIGQPKIWQFERVNSLLDGLLRDIEGVSLQDLIRLDPNAQNAAAVRFVQSALQAGGQFDQAAAVTNRVGLENFDLQRPAQIEQMNERNLYLQQLNQRRLQVTTDLVAANSTVAKLQPLKDSHQSTSAQDADLAAAQSRSTLLASELDKLNTLLGSSAPSLSSPTVNNTSAPQPPTLQPAFSSLADLLKNLPSGVQDSLASALKSPNYPATKQLDNFLTLLQERLAREVSVLQDDLIRDPTNLAFLVQFDVGLYPSNRTANHMARVEFDLNCPGCKIYSLYPGQSSYNTVNYQGASRRTTLWGQAATLVGFGISAAYQRQEDALQGSLVQSVYISGFQESAGVPVAKAPNTNAAKSGREVAPVQRFGWYYNAAPFDQYVSPGIKQTFAVITVPRRLIRTETVPAGHCLPIEVKGAWAQRDDPRFQKSHWFWPNTRINKESRGGFWPFRRESTARSVLVPLPGIDGDRFPEVIYNERDRIHVRRLEYRTAYHAVPEPAATTARDQSTACSTGECAGVLVTLDIPIDPNLVVTVNGRPLVRVRDWRGRATSVLPPAQSGSDAATPKPTDFTRSLLEVDGVRSDAWFALSSHDLLLNISRGLAGESEFPIIRITDPARKTFVIPTDLQRSFSELIINGFRMVPRNAGDVRRYIINNVRTSNCGRTGEPGCDGGASDEGFPPGPYPFSTYIPLFLPQRKSQAISAFVGETGEDLLIRFDSAGTGASRSWLETRTQVILEDRDLDFAWSLSCAPQGVYLACRIPLDSLRKIYLTLMAVCSRSSDCPVVRRTVETIRASGLEKQVNWPGWNTYLQRVQANPSLLDTASQPDLFVPNLQVWVEQWDPDNGVAFYSGEPAPMHLFPLTGNRKTPAESYRPWELTGLSARVFTLRSCRALPVEPGRTIDVRFLGVDPMQMPADDSRVQPQRRGVDARTCVAIDAPTEFLERSQLVMRITPIVPDAEPGTAVYRALFGAPDPGPLTVAVATDFFKPHFGRAQMARSGESQRDSWTVEFEATNLLKTDRVKDLRKSEAQACAQDGRVGETCRKLVLTLPRSGFRSWPERFHVIRTVDEHTDVDLGPLPDVRELLLPTTVSPQLTEKQLILRGRNAALIDRVSVTKDADTWTFPAAGADDVVVADLSHPIARPMGAAPRKDGKEAKPLLPPGTYRITGSMHDDTSKTDLPFTLRAADGGELTVAVAEPKSEDKKAETDKTTTVTTKTVEKPKPPAPATPPKEES